LAVFCQTGYGVQRSKDTPSWGYTMGGGDPIGLAVRGEIDLATAPELAAALGELLQEGHRNVALDLSDVEFLDSSGLHVLSKARARLLEAGGSLALSAVSDPVRRAVEISGLDGLLLSPGR
jgi:anti-anti-sigma factor